MRKASDTREKLYFGLVSGRARVVEGIETRHRFPGDRVDEAVDHLREGLCGHSCASDDRWVTLHTEFPIFAD
jgi:hypothetical protein